METSTIYINIGRPYGASNFQQPYGGYEPAGSDLDSDEEGQMALALAESMVTYEAAQHAESSRAPESLTTEEERELAELATSMGIAIAEPGLEIPLSTGSDTEEELVPAAPSAARADELEQQLRAAEEQEPAQPTLRARVARTMRRILQALPGQRASTATPSTSTTAESSETQAPLRLPTYDEVYPDGPPPPPPAYTGPSTSGRESEGYLMPR